MIAQGGDQLVQVNADDDGFTDLNIVVRNGTLWGGAGDFIL